MANLDRYDPASQRLDIRPVHPDDWPFVQAISTDRRVSRYMVQMPTQEASEIKDWLRDPIPGQHRLVLTQGGEVIALGELVHKIRPRLSHSGDITVMVHPDHWRKGYGSMLMEELLNLADDWLNLKRLQAIVVDQNSAGIALLEKHGFVNEGARRCSLYWKGRWFSDLIMARLRGVDDAAGKEIDAAADSSPIRTRKIDVALRPLRPEDKEELYELMRHPDVCKTTLGMPTQEIWLTEKRLDTHSPYLHRLVALSNDKLIGAANLKQYDQPRRLHCAGLSMAVHPDYWGLGVGSKLLETLIDLADNWLDLKRIELDVNTDNPVGIKLYKKYGFKIEGLRRCHGFGGGRMADSYFMSRINGTCY